MSKIAAIIGRFLIALIFVISGASKLMDVASTETMIVATGLPAGLAIPTGLFELIAGLCLAAGFMVRLVAVLLALFTAATILFFHNRFTDPMQQIMALKNVAIIGGLCLAFAHSQMWNHYYAITRERRGELAARDAEERIRDAELRAARAEARAEAMTDGHVAPGYVEAAPRTVITDYNHDGVPEVRRRRWFDW
ncbi:DoxX family protein [Novosphingobium aerophilum]|uniref:DoxX family protein n=1 Tax=Novosphingobium TaxID=165696 RepID=UPI0006C843C2|nr:MULTISPECIES: DoxX family protein [unclassified Novosphingobium]KPH62300.1 membrane protein [Novosphingobium sp. ST904]MPS67770.1 DoxX family protein [Novosphingobium sp.]TCM43364.1 putative oxidoreductase [Novosphingobium sp. ST904]WRT92988.1 DoxX family protein [Novosphingobium sp. RL4]